MKKSIDVTRKKGRAKNVGFFESIALRFAGRADGKKGLPRMDEAGTWTSPFMNKKVRAFAVFGDNVWTMLQQEHEEVYVRIEDLIGSIRKNQKCLEEARQSLSMAEGTANVQDTFRQKGEEKISDTVVRSRRAAEMARRLNPMKQEIGSLEKQILEDEKELRILWSSIDEDCNTVRMICQGAKDGMLQRLDVYWNSALKKHPESNRMPVVPKVEVVLEHEQKYMEVHQRKMNRAEAIMELSVNSAEEEVA